MMGIRGFLEMKIWEFLGMFFVNKCARFNTMKINCKKIKMIALIFLI